MPDTQTHPFGIRHGHVPLVLGLVQPLIGEATRAVVYDRAGIGRSEADSAPQTLARIAGDLSFLLQQLGSGPFILVGHSRGGWLSVLWQPHLAPP